MLSSKKPDGWKRWIKRFECYRIATGLEWSGLGGKADEIFNSFELTEEDQVCETVKQLFETHFVGRTNAIFDLTNEFKPHRICDGFY